MRLLELVKNQWYVQSTLSLCVLHLNQSYHQGQTSPLFRGESNLRFHIQLFLVCLWLSSDLCVSLSMVSTGGSWLVAELCVLWQQPRTTDSAGKGSAEYQRRWWWFLIGSLRCAELLHHGWGRGWSLWDLHIHRKLSLGWHGEVKTIFEKLINTINNEK